MSFENRREKIYQWMAEQNINLVLFEDSEAKRDLSLRYLCGHPSDALLFLSIEKKSLLVPWDSNMAALYAKVDSCIPYNKFERDPYAAARAAAEFFKIPYGCKIEIPSSTPYPSFLKYVESLDAFDVLCRNDGVRYELDKMRAVKDEDEIHIYRNCTEKTNEIISALEENIVNNILRSEMDVALFIEAECRKRGCEGTGFCTLAAGPSRSFGIHAFPPYTAQPFAADGLSILDFGIVFEGYTSDVTLTFARSINSSQKKQLELTENAFNLAYEMTAEAFAPGAMESAGLSGKELALAVDAYFKKANFFMPHGLGHGIGLEAHEAPYLRRAGNVEWLLEKGNIFTIEPGIYDPIEGGCRLENDILITDNGAEILTHSKIIHL